MTLYPEVQRKAQEEIDRVVGNERLPTLDDRENLPYVDALVKELFRCKPVTPLGTFQYVCTRSSIAHTAASLGRGFPPIDARR